MPGTPKKTIFAANLRTVAKASGHTGDPWEWVIARVSEGGTMGSLSDLLGCSRSWFNNFANSDPMRRAKLQQARIQASHALVDEALHIASNATPENERASRLKVDTLKWTAGKFNKVDYGEDKAATVNIDMGDLFNLALDKSTSLRGKIAIELPATPLLQGPGE